MENIYSENRKSAVSCQQIRFANDSHIIGYMQKVRYNTGNKSCCFLEMAIAKERKRRVRKNDFFFFEKIYRGKLSKLSVSYFVLIKKSSFLGHFCVTNSLTNRRTDGKVELQSCMSQLKTRKLNAGPADTGHARQKMGRVYAAPKPFDA